jgi:hypothetical protein
MKKARSVSCTVNGCSKTCPRDPVLEVACPKCKAPVGVQCGEYRPSEHKLSAGFSGANDWGHKERDILADRHGKYGACPLGGCGAAARERGIVT